MLEASLGNARTSAVPKAWADGPDFSSCSTLDDVIVGVRRLDHRSDELLSALVRRARCDPQAASTAMIALLPLAMARCARGRAQVDELVGELAIVIGEASGGCLAEDRVANRLVDRAWARLRRSEQRSRRSLACDPTELTWSLVDRGPDPADAAATRIDLERAVRWLSSADPTYRAATRAWDTAVSLSSGDERSSSARRRLKYARRLLRRSPVADLVA
jgi:hypothetical protein